MRFTRYTPFAIFIGMTLLAPASAPAAANKDMEELQRDMADLQQQVKDLQKALLDPKSGTVTAMQTMLQQAVDTANKTNGSVNSLNTGMMQTLQTALKGVNEQLTSVTGLSVTVNNIAGDVSNLESSVKDLQVTVNRQGQAINDILNQVKLIQAPAAAPPPPGVDTGSAAPGVTGPPPSGQALFSHAAQDEDAAKYDLALSEFKEFLRRYPDDGNAIGAQYNIGNIYYSQSKPDEAVKAFNAVIEQYAVNEQTTPSAYYMKGLALKQLKDKTGAIASFKVVVTKYPHAPEAGLARTQLTLLGPTATTAKKPSH